MQLEKGGSSEWRLSGSYDANSLLMIKKSVASLNVEGDLALDVSELETINAPIIALLLELRRHCESLTLIQCREDFKDMLQLYGLECIFQFA